MRGRLRRADTPGRKTFREADVVLAVGNSFNQHATFGFQDDLFSDRTLIHVNISATEIDKVYKADHGLVADARRAVVALTEALDSRVGPVAPVEVRHGNDEDRWLAQVTKKIHPGRLAQAIGRMLPHEG